jgi:hypothetical protein
MCTIGTQADMASVPLADGTTVATPDLPLTGRVIAAGLLGITVADLGGPISTGSCSRSARRPPSMT